MFKLEYKITDGDFGAINKRIALFYFLLYAIVSVVGVVVGCIAVALGPSKLMFVLGIVLIVLGGILALCAIMLLVAPKNFVTSAVKPSDDARAVEIDESGIAVSSDGEDIKIPFASVTEVRDKKQYLLVFIGKDIALLVKNEITSGQSLSELFGFLSARRGGLVNPATVAAEDRKTELPEQSRDDSPVESAEDQSGGANENADNDADSET